MPSLTPVSEAAESLGPVSEAAETLGAVAEGGETLSAFAELRRAYQYLYPGQGVPGQTLVGAVIRPGLYGNVVGHALGAMAERTETLTPLQES